MLVDALAHTGPGGGDRVDGAGPLLPAGSAPARVRRELAERARRCAGASLRARARPRRAPIAGAELDVWQNGDDRLYAVQQPEGPGGSPAGPLFHPRGRQLRLRGAATPYPIPYDGPVGAMLEATGRHPWRPAHLHMIIRAPGYRTVTTHVFDDVSEYLDSDAVFAVKPSLLRTFVEPRARRPRYSGRSHRTGVSVENDIVLAPRTS